MSATAPVRTLISKPPRQRVSVNGVAIGGQDILREARNHANERPADAWQAAATALVVKELLVQEARRLGVAGDPANDGEGRTETDEEAAIRSLVEREVSVPDATVEECRRYYENHRSRFRSATLTEASHILLAASPEDLEGRQAASATAQSLCDRLAADPDAFGALARQHSQCPSAGQGGSLGQLLPGTTVPEFESGIAALAPGETSRQPVETRFGYHVVRVQRRIEGRDLPFELVHDRIAAYLHDAAAHRAQAQYIARLVSAADIKGSTWPAPPTIAFIEEDTMLLGDLLARFNDPLVAEQALASLDDLTLVTAVTVKADAAGLSTGDYAAECVGTYADTATDEEWTTLIGQMGRSADPGSVLLKRALAASCSGGGTCGCGGQHG